MVERSWPRAEAPTGTALNCLVSKGVRVLDRVFHREAPRQAGGDRGGKSTARTVRVRGFDPRLGYLPGALAVPHHVHRNARVIAVAPFHHDDGGKVAETASGLARIVQGLEFFSEQHAGFEKVGGGNGSRTGSTTSAGRLRASAATSLTISSL